MTTRFGFARRTVALTLAAGVALGLAGCGNEARPGYADPNSGDVQYAAKALTKDEIFTEVYAAAMKAKTAHVVMKMSGKAKLKARGDLKYDGRQPSMAMTMSMAPMMKGTIEMRMLKGRLYMQIPNVTPPGKFLAIDPKDKTSPLAKSFANTPDQMDPMKSIKTLKSAVRSAERVGKQTMGGVTVEHYKLTVATAELLKSAGQAANAAGLPDTITYDLWLDERHLIRRTSFETAGVTLEATMSAWGKPVTVKAPPASQIVTMPKA
jgi:LppX/LprAFG-like lipoprotein